MSKKIYVGNLSFQSTPSDITQAFSGFGPVESVSVISERETCRSKKDSPGRTLLALRESHQVRRQSKGESRYTEHTVISTSFLDGCPNRRGQTTSPSEKPGFQRVDCYDFRSCPEQEKLA